MPRSNTTRANSSLTAHRARALRRELRAWYAAERRDLPWRRTQDPYAIWISEAMLQQTRVETVVDYWTRFLARFPTIEALAAAGEEEVMEAWSGLGYYRRARALRAAAAVLVAEHGGEFPREHEAALALPGIGPYTAGAVLSIAFDAPLALVDGNVERVFARVFELREHAASPALKRASWAYARELLPRTGSGDWNQALMELGALVCTPRAPRCPECPWRRECATAGEQANSLPLPRKKRDPIEVELEVRLARDGTRLLLERRPRGGRMAGLWEFPTIEREGPEGGLSGLFPATWAWGGARAGAAPSAVLQHGITHHRIRAQVRPGRVRAVPDAGLELPAGGELGWFDEQEVASRALTGMARKVLASLSSSPA